MKEEAQVAELFSLVKAGHGEIVVAAAARALGDEALLALDERGMSVLAHSAWFNANPTTRWCSERHARMRQWPGGWSPYANAILGGWVSGTPRWTLDTLEGSGCPISIDLLHQVAKLAPAVFHEENFMDRSETMLEWLAGHAPAVVCHLDEEGLTPAARAIREGKWMLARALLLKDPWREAGIPLSGAFFQALEDRGRKANEHHLGTLERYTIALVWREIGEPGGKEVGLGMEIGNQLAGKLFLDAVGSLPVVEQEREAYLAWKRRQAIAAALPAGARVNPRRL